MTGSHAASAFLYGGHDPGACSLYHRGHAHWVLGYPERALRDAQDACRLAEELKHPFTTTNALWFAALVHSNRGERELTLENLDRLISIARAYGITVWIDLSVAFLKLLESERMSATVAAEIHQHVASLPYLTIWRRTTVLCALAER